MKLLCRFLVLFFILCTIAVQAESNLFEFSDFEVIQHPDGRQATWTAKLQLNRTISAGRYQVNSVFSSRQGAELMQGEAISLPASTAGKAHSISRTYALRNDLFYVTLEVRTIRDGKTHASQRFQIGRVDTSSIAQTSPRDNVPVTSARPTTTVNQSGPVDLARDAKPEYSVEAVKTSTGYELVIKNNSLFPIRLDGTNLLFRFLAGVDGRDKVQCPQNPLRPGAECRVKIDNRRYQCASLDTVSLEIVANNRAETVELLQLDSRLTQIHSFQPYSIRKTQSPTQKGSQGKADMSVTMNGVFTRPGTYLIAEGIIEFDSSGMVPVALYLMQEAEILRGAREVSHVDSRNMNTKPSKVCFVLLKVATSDSLFCGGVPITLYRSDMDFWEARYCE